MTEYIVKCKKFTGITGNELEFPEYIDTNKEIVRCRDCKDVHHRPNWQPDKRFKPQDLWLCEAEWCMGFEGDHPRVEPDGFCWRGERRES